MCLMCFALVVVPSRTLANELKGEEIVTSADEATVLIGTADTDLSVGLGSGFFVATDLIVTNFHVIEDASVIGYMRYGQQEFHAIDSISHADSNYDLAVLRVPSTRVEPLFLGDSDSVKKGETVYVAGNPHGLVGTISKGIISGRQTSPGYSYIRKGVKLIQFEASVARGSSGGPVFNGRGEVIGIVSFGVGDSATGDFNFAIPSNYLKTMLRKLGVRLPSKPQPDSGASKLRNEEKAQADVERVIAEARRAEAEAKKVEAEARKAEAEARKAEAERYKAEAEKVKMEAKKAKNERPKQEPVRPKMKEVRVSNSKTAIIDRLKASTVHIIRSDLSGHELPLMSGFFVSPDKIATDFHVIEGSTLKRVRPLERDTTSAELRLVEQPPKTDRKHHLAILKTENADVGPLLLGNSDDVFIGEEIYMIGDPASGEVSEGKISDILEKDGVRYFEFDALVAPGSSGGPIVNTRGEVIAVTALKVVAITGTLKNAIPANYLKALLAGKGDPPPPSSPPSKHKVLPETASLFEPSPYREWLEKGIKHYEHAEYGDAIRLLTFALDGLTHPENRAKAHLYLGCARRGRGDSQESIIAEFREALSSDPNLELPHGVGKNHPIFKPLLEQARDESTGTLTVNASPPETQIWIYGGKSKQEHPYLGTVALRLFKGDYTVKCSLEESTLREANTNVKTIRIEPGVHYILDRELARMPSTSRELTLELDRAEKPQRVEVHFEIYNPSGQELDRGVKEMQLQGEKPNLGTYVYHVNWPPSTPAGRLTYRIKVDGEDILPIPSPEIVILEPPSDTWVYINQAIDLKARVTSDIQLMEVLVHYGNASKKLQKIGIPDTYTGTIPGRDNREAGTIWYFVTAKNQEGKMSRSEVRLVEIRWLDDETDTDSVLPPEITVLAPRGSAVLPINEPIEIKAKVSASTPLKEVRVHYDFPRSKLSEESPSTMLENGSSSDTYIGEIPRESNREEGYIWYFVTAITAQGMKSKSEDRVLEVKKPTTRTHQGVWASHSWSNLASNDGFYSGWARGNVLSLAFLSEGKGSQTLGVQLDYTYDNPDYISATAQWGPSTRENPVAFALLAGATGRRSSDPSFSRVRQSRQFTPLLGGSVKFYPLDRVVVDATASVKLQSENGAADRESSFTEDFLHHYEAGIRLYISPMLNLRAGYGRWRLGEYDNASMQIGLGATF